MSLIAIVIGVGIASLITGVPGARIAQRRGLDNPGVAYIPGIGLWIVLFQSVDRSGWLVLLALVPFLGALVISIWLAAEVPSVHGRSGWWTLVLLIPVVNIVAYWIYAYTLDQEYVYSFA